MNTKTLAGAALTLAALALPSAAQASTPLASTGGAQSVTASTAVLTGTVNPNGSDTAAYFQYGTTAAYGQQTAAQDFGSGKKAVTVRIPVANLAAFTQYHYRLVAVGAGGSTQGRDRTFTTAKIPLSIGIATAPNPTSYGGNTLVEGALSGTGNAGREVVLQSNPFPYLQGFQTIGNPQLTSASGTFAFPVNNLAATTQFRVATVSKPVVYSPVAVEGVTVIVSAHVHRTRRAHVARITGVVTPAEDGAQVAIEKIGRSGRYVTVAGTIVHGRTFARRVRVRRAGVYRVLVRVTNGAQLSASSIPLVIR